MRLYKSIEGEVVKDGVSTGETMMSWYVAIRRGPNILWIRIPKGDPKSYSVEELVKDEWNQKLWL